MKRILKLVLGKKGVQFLRECQVRFFPTKEQRKAIQEERIQLNKRISFYSTFINKGDLCFDVGANIGNRVEALLQIGAKVVAVEPQQSCNEILHKKFGNRIVIIKQALDEEECVKKFYISDSSTISSFSEEWIDSVKVGRFKNSSWSDGVETKMTTLDKLISEFGIPVFIKIDVEGFELNVLKGLNAPIKTISFEYTTPEQTSKAVDCISQIEKINPSIECNYSIGEGMKLSLPNWIPPGKMKEYMLSKAFIDSGFGDVYVRTRNS